MAQTPPSILGWKEHFGAGRRFCSFDSSHLARCLGSKPAIYVGEAVRCFHLSRRGVIRLFLFFLRFFGNTSLNCQNPIKWTCRFPPGLGRSKREATRSLRLSVCLQCLPHYT